MQALIVEDEVLTAMHLEAVLEDLGVESVGIAADLANAVALATKGPDLALVDLNLRDGFTGPTIAQHLSRYGVAILFVTANPGQLGEARALAVDVLNKPFVEDELAGAVQQVRQLKETGQREI